MKQLITYPPSVHRLIWIANTFGTLVIRSIIFELWAVSHRSQNRPVIELRAKRSSMLCWTFSPAWTAKSFIASTFHVIVLQFFQVIAVWISPVKHVSESISDKIARKNEWASFISNGSNCSIVFQINWMKAEASTTLTPWRISEKSWE